MVKRIIAIGGVPASGKTTLLRKVMSNYELTPFSYGLVKGVYNKELKLYFIGVFDGSTFEGTDRLSMAVQPDFIKFLNYVDGVVIYEGDRLFNQAVLDQYNNLTIKIILEPSNKTLDERHKIRQDNQSSTFLKSKRTKINNILKKYDDCIVFNNEDDTDKIIEYIIDGINY